MRSVNKVMMIGHLAADPEVRQTKKGVPVANFPLATNRDWVTDNGDPSRVTTDYHKIVAWDRLAEVVREHLVKGMGVYIEGRLMNRSFELPDKSKRFVTEIRLDVLNVLSWKKRDGGVEEVVLDDPEAAAETASGAASDRAKPAKVAAG